MRKLFVAVNTRHEARKACPWAAVLAKAYGGYWAFETDAEYRQWRRQK